MKRDDSGKNHLFFVQQTSLTDGFEYNFPCQLACIKYLHPEIHEQKRI